MSRRLSTNWKDQLDCYCEDSSLCADREPACTTRRMPAPLPNPYCADEADVADLGSSMQRCF